MSTAPDPGGRDRRLPVVGEVVSLGTLVVVLVAATALSLADDPAVSLLPLVAWAFGAAVVAALLATVRNSPWEWVRDSSPWLPVGLLLLLLACDVGLVTAGGGLDNPFWVVFLPLVLVTALQVPTAAAVLVGVLAGIGVLLAGGISGTLDASTAGVALVAVPVLPAVAAVVAPLAAAVARISETAARERDLLAEDVARLGLRLEAFGSGTEGDRGAAPGTVATAALADSLDAALSALAGLTGQVRAGAASVGASAGEVFATARDQAEAAREQAAAVSETSATVEQLAAAARTIAASVEAVATSATATRAAAEDGLAAVTASGRSLSAIAASVSDVDAAATALRSRGDRIGRAVEVIEDLANQTNLLALNAAIEAARVDDGGAGFATVAASVRRLAERCREETASIREAAAAIEQGAREVALASAEGAAAVRSGDALCGAAATALERITAMVARTGEAALEISSATDEQRVAAEQVVPAMGAVAEVSDRYAQGAVSAAEAAARLDQLAVSLRSGVAGLAAGAR